MIKTFDKYFIILFLKKIFLLTLIFFSLTFILTLFEEITFFSDSSNSEFHLPFMITLLNVPSTLLEIFPFIILISTQLFFVEIIKRKENELIKVNTLDLKPNTRAQLSSTRRQRPDRRRETIWGAKMAFWQRRG